MTDNLHRHSAQYSSFTCSTLTLVQADKLFIRHPTVDFFNLLNWIYFFIALNCTYDNNNLKSLVWDKKRKTLLENSCPNSFVSRNTSKYIKSHDHFENWDETVLVRFMVAFCLYGLGSFSLVEDGITADVSVHREQSGSLSYLMSMKMMWIGMAFYLHIIFTLIKPFMVWWVWKYCEIYALSMYCISHYFYINQTIQWPFVPCGVLSSWKKPLVLRIEDRHKPLRIEVFHNRIELMGSNNLVLICSDPQLRRQVSLSAKCLSHHK